ncbi:MAG: RnfABCDGE type electron transport complex subunit B [Kiritimatiellaeota bacterium]|nr:RnfABCDGE type electron transport complex subunit B [Kiritimatiellota bacterium]
MIFGALLAYASIKFFVETDERIMRIRAILPGANCAGCGYPGCDGYAEGIVDDGAKTNLCAAGGADLSKGIADILGIETDAASVPMRASLKCGGTPEASPRKATYNGIADCIAAHAIHGGDKACTYGCLGYGSCARACLTNGIAIADGLARVDRDRCIACGACVTVCPRHLIKLVPATHTIHVRCSSKDKGSIVRSFCARGCIGCKLCAKADPAFVMDGFLAAVDYAKPPVANDAAIAKCPGKCISGDMGLIF